jgi:hypothetical protein
VFSRVTTRYRSAASVLALLLSGASLAAQPDGDERAQATVEDIMRRAANTVPDEVTGWSIALDNDLFGPAHTDRDYTGGLGVSVYGAPTAKYWWSLDRLLKYVDEPLFARSANWQDAQRLHAVQAGVVIFTPQDITSAAVVENDRPYASMLFVTSSRDYIAAGERGTRYSGLTLGVLGLRATTDLQEAVHKVIRSDDPRGSGNQISEGGELTARYFTGGSQLRAQRLAFGDKSIEAKTTWEMSAGYLTEASYSISTRFGVIDSPWWTFNPERVDYMVQPAPQAPANGRSEMYFFAGAKVRLRAYNAFLQGQFRDSVHTISAGDLNYVIGEAWLGFATRLSGGTQISYAVRYETAEIRDGLANRSPVWGGVTISHSF